MSLKNPLGIIVLETHVQTLIFIVKKDFSVSEIQNKTF